MANIQKRVSSVGKVSYRARVRIEGNPLKTATFPTRREAERWANKMEAEIRAGRYFGCEVDKEKTFAEFIDRYISLELPKNPKSEKKVKNQLLWWKSHLGSYFLCHISPSMIAGLRDKLLSEVTRRKKLRTASTTNRMLAALSKAFTIAVKDWQWVKENPVHKIIRPKENKPRDRYLEKDEIEMLLKLSKESRSAHLYPIILFAIASGARKSEILSLKYSDLDFTRSTVTFNDTKNGDTRTISVSPKIMKCLLNETKKRVVLSEFVFPSRDGKKTADIESAWKNLMKRMGWTGEVCFHTLRHTAASKLCHGGISALEIGQILGHRSMNVTKKYCHHSVASTAKALHKMNDEILGEFIDAG